MDLIVGLLALWLSMASPQTRAEWREPGPVMDPGPEVVAGEDKIRRRK